MDSISSLLKSEGFSNFHNVACRHSIADLFRELLRYDIFLLAAKKFNLARFRTGAQPWAIYHCPILADHLLQHALK